MALDIKLLDGPTWERARKTEIKNLEFEEFLCDIDDNNKKVRVTYSYVVSGDEVTVEEWKVKLLEPFIMNDADITLSMMEVLYPVTQGVNYACKIEIIPFQ